MTNILTLQELYSSILADIEAQYEASLNPDSKTALNAISKTLATKLKLLYLTLGNAQKNMYPDTADPIAVGGTLERWGFLKLGRYPFQATSGQYVVAVTGSINAIIPAQTTFISDDTSENPGQLFILDAAYTMVSGSNFITLRALTPGTVAALRINDTLTATSPLALIDSSVIITSEAVQPLDAETTDAYRQEVINTFREVRQGGAATDYRLWSQDAQGVAAVYPYSAPGFSNQINLYIESVISDSIDNKGTPSTEMIANVQSVVEFNPDDTLPILKRGRKALTAIVNYLPVTIDTVDINIPGYVGITSDQEAIITSAITAYVNLIRPFVAAADTIADKNDTLDVNNIVTVILSAIPGASFGTPTIQVNGISVTSFQFLWGNIPSVGNITFI